MKNFAYIVDKCCKNSKFLFFLVLCKLADFGRVNRFPRGMARLKATNLRFPKPVEVWQNLIFFSRYDVICRKSTSLISKNHIYPPKNPKRFPTTKRTAVSWTRAEASSCWYKDFFRTKTLFTSVINE